MSVTEKIEQLRRFVQGGGPRAGAVLVVYSPDEELDFRQRYSVLIREWRAANIACVEFDLASLPFEVMKEHVSLEKLFKLDVDPRKQLQQDIATLVEPELVERVSQLAQAHPDGVICLRRPAALYPWVSYSYLLERCENEVANTIIIPFPGDEQGPELHFLGAKDGYNYRAARL